MDLAKFTLKLISYAIVDPYLVTVLIIIAFMLFTQNKKTTVMQKMIIGERLNSPLELTLSELVLGISVGVIGSLILTYFGVIFNNTSGIEYIFLVSIALMIWKPRFICFAYSGAILGILSLIINDLAVLLYGKPLLENFLKVDIVALMTLIGVLHIVEGLLISIDGDRGSIPVFTNRDGKIIGGFALKRYWPIPILIMFLTQNILLVEGEAIGTPGWWPLINLSYTADFLRTAVIGAVPLYGILGYNSVTFTMKRREKALLSGGFTLLYGVILALVAQVAFYGIAWKILVLIFAPLTHEAMLKLQKYIELKRKPQFISDKEGISVLEVAPGSPAEKMGIESGDTILMVNDNIINVEKDIFDSIEGTINFVSFKIKKSKGEEVEANYTNLSKERKLGILFVPRDIPKESMVVRFEEGNFKDILDKFKDKD